MSPKAAAAAAGAEAIARSTLAEEGSRAYAAEPMPDSPLPRYSRSGDDGNGAVCHIETRTETLPDGTERQQRIETCE